jgi:hypothetical protein
MDGVLIPILTVADIKVNGRTVGFMDKEFIVFPMVVNI